LKTLIAYWKSLKCSATGLACALLLILTAQIAFGQQDTVAISSADTSASHIRRLDPRKALFYSAVFPGMGQMYNNKYWKLPLVYGGFAVGLTVVNFYQKNYKIYRDDLFILISSGVSPSGRTESNLRFIVDKTRRQRDYWIILSGIWYLLQAVDAHVDAHLQEFKFIKNVNATLRPSFDQSNITGRTSGFTLTFKF
jgi:Family of unknown function (DUF5683)